MGITGRDIARLVLEAAHSLNIQESFTPKDVINYITRNYGVTKGQISPIIYTALKRGTGNGIFRIQKGRYALGATSSPSVDEPQDCGLLSTTKVRIVCRKRKPKRPCTKIWNLRYTRKYIKRKKSTSKKPRKRSCKRRRFHSRRRRAARCSKRRSQSRRPRSKSRHLKRRPRSLCKRRASRSRKRLTRHSRRRRSHSIRRRSRSRGRRHGKSLCKPRKTSHSQRRKTGQRPKPQRRSKPKCASDIKQDTDLIGGGTGGEVPIDANQSHSADQANR